MTVDAEGCVSSWNSGAGQLFGYREAEVRGWAFDLLFCAEDRAAGVPERELLGARELGRAADERWYLREDGSRFFAAGVTTPLRDGERVTGYVKVVRDLSAQRRAEEERELLLEAVQDFNAALEQRVAERTAALRLSEQRFSQAFCVNPIAACMTTPSPERFLEVNDAFLEMTGYGRAEVLGRTNGELGLWSSAADQQKLEAAACENSTLQHLELQLRIREGELRDILLSGEAIGLDGEPGQLKMFYDVTERKRTQEQLRQAISEVMTDTTWLSRRILDQLARLKAGKEVSKEMHLSRREQ